MARDKAEYGLACPILGLHARCATVKTMERVGIRDLKQNASRVLQRVKAGESLEVTERGRPIARLTPVNEEEDGNLLAERGELTVGTQHVRDGRPMPIASGAPLSAELESLRDDWR